MPPRRRCSRAPSVSTNDGLAVPLTPDAQKPGPIPAVASNGRFRTGGGGGGMNATAVGGASLNAAGRVVLFGGGCVPSIEGGGAVPFAGGGVPFAGGSAVVFPGGGGVVFGGGVPASSCFCSSAILFSTSARLCALGEFRRYPL